MSDQNVGLVKQGYDAFGRGDVEGLVSLLSEDIEWTAPGPKELPSSGVRRGHDQVRQFFGAINELYEFLAFEPQQFIGQGDTVVVTGIDTVRVKTTGKSVSGIWAHVFTVRNGKVVKFVEYLDTAPIVAELHAARAKA